MLKALFHVLLHDKHITIEQWDDSFAKSMQSAWELISGKGTNRLRSKLCSMVFSSSGGNDQRLEAVENDGGLYVALHCLTPDSQCNAAVADATILCK